MIPYVAAIILVESTRLIKQTSKQKKLLVNAICALTFVLLLGLRHPSMGHDLRYLDSYGYLGGFQSIAKSAWTLRDFKNYEVGYILFNKLISVFTTDNQVFLLICAACSILPFSYVIQKNSFDIQTSYILLFGNPIFTLMFSGIRQSIAIGILFLSIGFIKQKKPIAFFLVVFLATLFHDTAFVFIAAYPIYHFGDLKKNFKIVLISSIVVAFILRRPLLTTVGGLISDKNVIDNNGSLNLFLICVFFLAILLYVFRSDDKEFNGYIKIYYLACFAMVFSNINVLAMRTAYYFLDILLLLVPSICKDEVQKTAIIKIKPQSALLFIINFLFVFLGFFYILTTNWANAYPYLFFWQ